MSREHISMDVKSQQAAANTHPDHILCEPEAKFFEFLLMADGGKKKKTFILFSRVRQPLRKPCDSKQTRVYEIGL